ncbi:hypothetical protein HQ571_00065 [Candidatus Kuenenbacteria bacterium]|nr:hypothetical protein [Candidatus Kuenenbacteria bacterium]
MADKKKKEIKDMTDEELLAIAEREFANVGDTIPSQDSKNAISRTGSMRAIAACQIVLVRQALGKSKVAPLT